MSTVEKDEATNKRQNSPETSNQTTVKSSKLRMVSVVCKTHILLKVMENLCSPLTYGKYPEALSMTLFNAFSSMETV